MRTASAALLSLLFVTPCLAGGSATMHVGLVVTGASVAPASQLSQVAGEWTATSAVESGTHRVKISGSGLTYDFIAAEDPSSCDIRVTGTVESVDKASANMIRYYGDHRYLTPDYVVRYSVKSAEAVGASPAPDACDEAAASFASSLAAAGAEHRLVLSRGADDELIESLTGTEFTRARAN